jgi:hypothetical protein
MLSITASACWGAATVSSGSRSSTAWASGMGPSPSLGAMDCASWSNGTVPAATSSTRRHRRRRLAASAAGGRRRVWGAQRGTVTSVSPDAAWMSTAGETPEGCDGCDARRQRSPASATNSSLSPRTSRSRSIRRPVSVRRPPSLMKFSTIRWRIRSNESSSTESTARCVSRRGLRSSARNSCATSATASASQARRPPGGGNPCATTTARTVR